MFFRADANDEHWTLRYLNPSRTTNQAYRLIPIGILIKLPNYDEGHFTDQLWKNGFEIFFLSSCS